MLVSAVIVGLVPYYAMDPDTPISSAFASHGMQWAAYVHTHRGERFIFTELLFTALFLFYLCAGISLLLDLVLLFVRR